MMVSAKVAALLLSLQFAPIFPSAGFHSYFHRLQQSAASGNAAAQLCIGQLAAQGFTGTNGQDFYKAIGYYKKAEARSPLRAKQLIGQLYLTGYGSFKPDRSKALRIFNSLIKHGYTPAATDIGKYYLLDYGGLKPDFKKALYWFKRGAAGGDPFAEVALGRIYGAGLGVPRNPAQSRRRLAKAAAHRLDCLADFASLADDIIEANIHWPEPSKSISGTFTVIYKYHNGRAIDAHAFKKSSDKKINRAWLVAIKASKLPPWPKNYSLKNKHIGFEVATDSELFRTWMFYSIRSALVIPKKVIVYGSKGTGIVDVTFDFLDGKVSNVRIQKSSGDRLEDAAAVRAVEDARYPPTPPRFIGVKQHLAIPLNFAID